MMLKSKELFGRWRNSAAGKISVILFIVSIVLLILACSPWGNFSERVANNINNILFGLATNLLGIIVTVSFVQYFIDKQDARQEEREEKAQILRYNRLMSVLVQRYKMYFYCVVTPMEMRAQKDINALDENFNFEDMCDLHEQSLYICDGCAESSIALLYKAENKVREYMVRMLESVQFKYNEELKNVILEFVEKSYAYDVREGILGNEKLYAGQKKISEMAKDAIADVSYNWVEKVNNGEVKSNIIVPYVQLYELLREEIQILKRYTNYITKIENEEI